MSKNITKIIKTVYCNVGKTTQNAPENSGKTALFPIPKAPSRPSPRCHKLCQICGPDAHQATNAAAWKRPTPNQTADSFGADRELNGHSRNRQKRGKGSCAGCPKGGGICGYLLSLRHGQVLPPLIAAQPSAVLPIVPRPAQVPPKQHAPHPPHQPKLRVGGRPLRQMRERDAPCESRYATPKNRAGENPVTGSERVRQSQAVGPRLIGWLLRYHRLRRFTFVNFQYCRRLCCALSSISSQPNTL